jgi:CrcB protein
LTAGDDSRSDDPRSDKQGEHPRPLPLYLRPRYVAIVFVGGAVGTTARYLVGLFVPVVANLPLATLSVNLVGAFLLGLLLEGLARRGPDHGSRLNLRLLLGTGFMGGFTTYSSFAVETTELLGTGHVWLGIGYALLTVIAGFFAAMFGVWLAARAHRVRTR